MHTRSRQVLPVVHSITRQSSSAVKLKPAPESAWSTSSAPSRRWQNSPESAGNHNKWTLHRGGEQSFADPSTSWQTSPTLEKWRPAASASFSRDADTTPRSTPRFEFTPPGQRAGGSTRQRYDPGTSRPRPGPGRYTPNARQARSNPTQLDRQSAPHLAPSRSSGVLDAFNDFFPPAQDLAADKRHRDIQRSRTIAGVGGFGGAVTGRGASAQYKPKFRLAEDEPASRQLGKKVAGEVEKADNSAEEEVSPQRSAAQDDAESSDVYYADEPAQRGKHAGLGMRGDKDKKQRGSLTALLAEGIEVTLPGQSRSKDAQVTPESKPKKVKALKEKQVTLDIYIPSTVSVGTLSMLLNVKLEILQRKMRQAGMDSETSPSHILTSDYAVLLAEEFGRRPVINDEAAFDIYPPMEHPDPTSLPVRSPVITIMGHVDHGKTTLLDSLRSSAVAKGEAGGITQHIGAFSVPVKTASADGPKSITFLDTPGHAAFSAMRARGAGVTDLVVLVVAADDGIMPQTKEVINLIKQDEERVGVVVAITKVDKPEADVDAVHRGLMAEGIQVEAMGGDIPSVEVSGVTGQGLPDLVETLSAMAEMRSLHAEDQIPIHGYVLESKVLKGLGPVATVLVMRGSLKPGAHLISGLSQAKVRLMTDSAGKPTKVVPPGTAVTVSGWKTLPNAGDEVLQASEADIKKALVNRERQADLMKSLVDVEAINISRRQEREVRQLEEKEEERKKKKTVTVAATEDAAELEETSGPKELRLMIKGDVSGSVEAVAGALTGIGNHVAITKIISSSVGDITESDITMAKNCGAMLVGFSVNAPRSIEQLAARSDVPIYTSPIIYRIMEEVKTRVIGLLPPIVEKRVIGEASVLDLFTITLKGKKTKQVAGCRVTNGIVEKSKLARLVRNGETIFEGSLDTMRHLKKEVTELRKGTECGLSLGDFDSVQVGDMIQSYENVESPGSL